MFIIHANLHLCALLDLHTEAVQAALAKYKERKMPMPSKRRSVLVQSSVEACTPPGESLFCGKTGKLGAHILNVLPWAPACRRACPLIKDVATHLVRNAH